MMMSAQSRRDVSNRRVNADSTFQQTPSVLMRDACVRLCVTHVLKNSSLDSHLIMGQNTSTMRRLLSVAARAPRINECGVQMISEDVWRQVFKQEAVPSLVLAPDVRASIQHSLSSFGLWGRTPPLAKDTGQLQVPSFPGNTLKAAIEHVAQRQCEPYLSLAVALSQLPSLPQRPIRWQRTPGWTKYCADGSHVTVACPDAQAVVFDTENCVTVSHHPVMAVAVGVDAWYSWTATCLAQDNVTSAHELIPMSQHGGAGPRVVVGHHVSYDRQRVQEEYALQPSPIRFIDTMSLHTATSGLSSQQQSAWKQQHADFSKSEAMAAEGHYQVRVDEVFVTIN